MNPQAFIGLFAICVSILGAAFAFTWRMATVASQLGSDSKLLREKIDKLDDSLENVSKIPDHERRLGNVEAMVHHQANMYAEMRTDVALLQREFKSVIPPRPRSPSFGDNNT